MTPPLPDFRSRAFLLDHVRETLAFYLPRAFDPAGGFFQFFRDDGEIVDRETRHLVSSTRYVFTFAMARRHFGDPVFDAAARHAAAFVKTRHRNPSTGGYAWVLRGEEVRDGTNHCYGLAFVLLAYAHATLAGLDEFRADIDTTFDLMERRFWSDAYGLYADEASADWSVLSPYRGQNANMHACEALLAAFDATGKQRFLDRALLIADHVTRRQAALADGLVWEHYHADWSVDWHYNFHDRTNIFRPWGFQPGHLTEWAKLLLILRRHRARLAGDTAWLLTRAKALFDVALATAWDERHGGIHYGFAPDRSLCDADKYHWVQAESLAAAALLADATGDAAYWGWYDRLWRYCWAHFVDHEHGAWFRILGPDNARRTDLKSPAGKVDYHNMGACYEVLNVLPADSTPN